MVFLGPIPVPLDPFLTQHLEISNSSPSSSLRMFFLQTYAHVVPFCHLCLIQNIKPLDRLPWPSYMKSHSITLPKISSWYTWSLCEVVLFMCLFTFIWCLRLLQYKLHEDKKHYWSYLHSSPSGTSKLHLLCNLCIFVGLVNKQSKNSEQTNKCRTRCEVCKW